MDASTAKTCMLNGIAVLYDNKQYHRINALTWRKYIGGEARNDKAPVLCAELYDGRSNGVIIARVDKLSLIKEEKDGRKDMPQVSTAGSMPWDGKSDMSAHGRADGNTDGRPRGTARTAANQGT